MDSSADHTRFLRRTLQANGGFSALSGIVLIVASQPLASLLGIKLPIILAIVGAGLLVYAAGLFRNALRSTVSQIEVWIAIAMDGGWVLGSAVLIYAGVLTSTGNWVVALAADMVLLFGVLQYYGLRKLRLAPSRRVTGPHDLSGG